MKSVRVLNIKILSIRKQELLEQFDKGVLFTPNVDHLVKLQKDREFYEAYKNAEWIVCDSVILFRLSRLLKLAIVESIPGSTFFSEFCNYHKNDTGCRIFILGGKTGVASKAQNNINKRIGRKIVVGAYGPSFSFVGDESENAHLIKIINESEATVLMVCATSPKQEVWINKYRYLLPSVRLFMALGATVDFEAGIVKRCPLKLQRLGLEWFWRFCQEPRRLFKRYFIDDIKIFWYLGKQIMGCYKSPYDSCLNS